MREFETQGELEQHFMEAMPASVFGCTSRVRIRPERGIEIVKLEQDDADKSFAATYFAYRAIVIRKDGSHVYGEWRTGWGGSLRRFMQALYYEEER